MSNKNRNRNSLLSSHNRSSHTNSTSKDELLKLKYLMETPNLPIYPLNDSSIINSKTNDNLKIPLSKTKITITTTGTGPIPVSTRELFGVS